MNYKGRQHVDAISHHYSNAMQAFNFVSFLILFVWSLFFAAVILCLLDYFLFFPNFVFIKWVFSPLSNQPPNVCICLKITQTPPYVLSLGAVDFKKQHMYCTVS